MYFSLKFRWSRKKCYGLDKKYETCFSKQVFYEIIKNINEVLLFFFEFPENRSATTFHEQRFWNLPIKFVNERKSLIQTFTVKVCKKLAIIQRIHAAFFAKVKTVNQ